MCLISKSSKPSISKRDIRCFKVYICINGKYISPYQRSVMPNFWEDTTTTLQTSNSNIIKEGFHSFESYNDAEDEAIWVAQTFLTDAFIIRCSIPEGSKYYSGTYNSIPAYCSESIRTIEVWDVINYKRLV